MAIRASNWQCDRVDAFRQSVVDELGIRLDSSKSVLNGTWSTVSTKRRTDGLAGVSDMLGLEGKKY